MKNIIALFCTVFLVSVLMAQPKIQLTNFASGFSRPVDIAHCGDSRLFIVEQAGKIWMVDSLGNKSPQPFLDIDPRVNSSGNEQGLLGLAFHPNYAQNGYFYVHYSQNNGGDTRVSRFSVDPLNPNLADPNSEKTILEQDQPYSNHNGGSLKFGPDGYLYTGLGDGGSAGDPQGNGQKKNTWLSKILRIDVDGGDPYAVPPSNPFVSDPAYKPEIWSTGLRNPWRISFDRLTGDLWIGDVGQNAKEEIDFQPAGVGGYNFGWKCFEGTNQYSTSGCGAASNYTPPAFQYANPSIGCSVTGGFVYRGSKYADLYGVYLLADYCSGRIWGTRRNANGTFSSQELANLQDYEFSSFGEDKDGELYVAMLSSGSVRRITELCSGFQISGVTSGAVCDSSFSGTIFLDVTGAAGTPTFLWSNDRTEKDIVYLNPGTYSVIATDGNGCIRRDTFEIERLNPPPPIELSVSTTLCNGEVLDYAIPAAPAGYGIQWFLNGAAIQGATDSVLSISAAGNYSVAYTGGTCPTVTSNYLQIQTVNVDAPVIFADGDSLYTDAVGFLQWFLNDTLLVDATGSTLIAPATGSYTLQLIGTGGCTVLSAPLAVVSAPMPAAVQAFRLSPNPTQGNIQVEMELSSAQSVTLHLTDTQNRILQTVNLSGKSLRQSLDLGTLPSGTYFLVVQLGKDRFVRKVVKE